MCRAALRSVRAAVRSVTPFVVSVLAACGDGSTAPDVEVTLSQSSVSLYVGETASLTATVTGGSGGAVSYSTSDASVATVSSSGTVTAVGVGTATITASASGASATATVTVNPSTIAVSPTTLDLEVGESGQLTATITGGVGLAATWSSSDESVASVDASGLVTAEAAGDATVTAAVTGQSGVEATAAVTVTQTPPALYLESLTTLDGDPLDVNAVSGVFIANLTVEGPPGTTGTIEVLLGDVLVASEDVTLPSAAPARGPARDIYNQETPVAVSTITAETLDDMFVLRNLNGLASLQPRLVTEGGVVDGVRRDGGPIADLNLDNAQIGYVVGPTSGSSVLNGSGQEWNYGSGAFEVHVLDPGLDLADIERIEVVTGGASAVYGGDAVGGVVNFIVNPTDYEGTVTFEGLHAYLTDGSEEDLLVANKYADYLGDLSVKASYRWDNKFPTFTGQFTYPTSFWAGKDLDFTDWASVNANFSDANFTDGGSGIKYCEWRTGTNFANLDIGGFAKGGDLSQTGGFDYYLERRCYDWAGHPCQALLLDGASQPLRYGVDHVPVDASFKIGADYISVGAINPNLDQRIAFNVSDPVPQGLTGSSGPVLDEWDLKLTVGYAGVSGQDVCVTGTFDANGCGFVRRTGSLGVGFKPDISGRVGEFTAWTMLYDNAWNATLLGTNFTVDPVAPGLLDLTFDPLELVPGAQYHVNFNATDNFKLTLGAVGSKFTGYDDIFLGNLTEWSRAYDNTYPTTATLDATIGPFIAYIQDTGTAPPNGPNGNWHVAENLSWGAKDAGHNLTIGSTLLTGFTAPTGTQTTVDGTYADPNSTSHGCFDLGGGCPGLPTAFTQRVFALIPGSDGNTTFNFTSAQYYVRYMLDTGLMVNLPVGEPATPVLENMGSYWQAGFETTFSASVLPPVAGTYEGFFLLHDDHYNALRTQPRTFSLTVSLEFSPPAQGGTGR